jgi:hypothetical protein
MKVTLIAFSLAFAFGRASGGEAEHLALAREFDRLSSAQDKEQMAGVWADMLIEDALAPDSIRGRLVAAITTALTSEEYLNKKARVYMEIFTEEELKQVIEVVKLPGFKLMNSKRADFTTGLAQVSREILLGDKIRAILYEEDPEDGTDKVKAEQGGADQPATAPEVKPEGKRKPEPDSEPAPR